MTETEGKEKKRKERRREKKGIKKKRKEKDQKLKREKWLCKDHIYDNPLIKRLRRRH